MLKSNTVLKILSLLLAIALWAFVIGEVNPTVKKTIHNVPVTFTNVESLADRELALASQEGYYVDIVVKGAKSDIGQLELEDIRAVADIYGYNEGENNVSVDVSVPNYITLEEVRSNKMTVTIEKLATVSKTVTVEFTGTVSDDVESTLIEVTPPEVEVSGAESIIEKVDSVKVQVDAGTLSEKAEFFNEAPIAYTKSGKEIKNVTMSAGTVEVQAVRYHIKEVPLEVKVTGRPAGDPEITVPGKVTIKGTKDDIEKITGITAADVDLSEITDSTTIPLEITLPGDIELADKSKNIGIKVEF